MATPRRVTWRRGTGRIPMGTTLVTRTTNWGNPFRVGDPGVPDNATAVRLHREWLLHSTEGVAIPWGAKGATRMFSPTWQRLNVHRLGGRDLACNCLQGEPCHGDTLVELANA